MFPAIIERSTFFLEPASNPLENNPNKTFSFPTVQKFVVAVYMDKPNITDISI